jgi:hypothetical protein
MTHADPEASCMYPLRDWVTCVDGCVFNWLFWEFDFRARGILKIYKFWKIIGLSIFRCNPKSINIWSGMRKDYSLKRNRYCSKNLKKKEFRKRTGN